MTFLVHLPSSQYPYLHEFTAKHVLQPGYSFGRELAFGLDLVLDALERAGRRGFLKRDRCAGWVS